MRNYSVRLLIIGLIFFTACSKDGELVETPPPDQLDLLTTISNSSWELYMYNILTDREKYYFTGAEIKKHSLSTVSFSRDGNYSSSDTDWSGTYLFLNDSTQIVLTPTISYLVPCVLNLDYISVPRILFSSPSVQVNPEKTDASDYEKFVAYQGLKFLHDRRKDISKLKSIKIELRYSAR